VPHHAPAGENIPAASPLLAAKSKDEFAVCLRELRAQAGGPSFRQLARTTNYASSTLADATSGRRLPTESVVKALVAACGADPAPWLEQLRQIAALEQRGRSDAYPDQGGQDPDGSGAADGDAASRQGMARQFFSRRRPAVLAAGGLAVLAAGLGIGWLAASATSAPATNAAMELPGVPSFFGIPAPAPTARVTDGVDPVVGHCEADSRLVDRAAVILDGMQVGALDLRYSPRCGAGWAKLYLYAGEPTMMGEVTVRSGDDRFSTIGNPLIKQVDDYTDVIVPGPGGCLGAGGKVYEAGRPVVTAVIPCEAPTGPAS
jgi:Protein of unknown function (DUF2690)/Helix-turn-helix domain